MTNLPTSRPLTLAEFPAELRQLERWVLWKYEPPSGDPQGKLTKIPYQVNGAKASTTDPNTWTSFENAVAHRNGCAGVGFVFAEEDGFIFIDFDHCRNADTGVIDPWAKEIITRLSTYSEVSPSGTGIHSICRGTLPPTGRKKGSLEMYGRARFGTVTGWHLEHSPTTVEACDLAPLHKRMMASEFVFPEASTPTLEAQPSNGLYITNNMALLWEGRWQECRNPVYPSQSEADFALVVHLAQECATAEEIDSRFRKSGLFREKWDRDSYGLATIRKVLARAVTPPASPSIVCRENIPDPRSIASQPTRCLVDSLLPEGQLVVIAGEASAGKTWFAMMLAHALVNGEQFLGRNTIRCDSVLYLDRENPLSIVRERFTSLFGELETLEETRYRHWGMWLNGGPPSFDSKQYEPFAVPGAVLIFDSLSRYHCGDENSPTEMVRVFEHLRQLQALGASVIVLHHRPKNLEAGYRGTTAIVDSVDALYSFSRDKQPDVRILKQIKARTALDTEVNFSVDWDLPSMTPTDNVQVIRRREHALAISGLLRNCPAGARQIDLIDQMIPQGYSRSQTIRCLNSREGDLWISTGGGSGSPKIYRLRIVLK